MPRELIYANDENGSNSSDVVWVFAIQNPPQLIRVLNAQWEADADEDGTYYYPSWESWTIDGREPTDEESDEYDDDIRQAVRASLNSSYSGG